jgi:hypothetical protein
MQMMRGADADYLNLVVAEEFLCFGRPKRHLMAYSECPGAILVNIRHAHQGYGGRKLGIGFRMRPCNPACSNYPNTQSLHFACSLWRYHHRLKPTDKPLPARGSHYNSIVPHTDAECNP